jgi:predicted dehydrogenase
MPSVPQAILTGIDMGENRMKVANKASRRSFLKNAAATGTAFLIVPRHVLGRGFTPPSDTLNIAGIGVGGMGRTNLINLSSQNIVALCDVDWGYAGRSLDRLGADAQRLQARLDQPDPSPAPGQPPIEFDRRKAKMQLANMLRLQNDILPRTKRYQDYRELLDRQKDIDAVFVATADHMHAPIALAAMDLGKHVYVQKPLTWSIAEARLLARRAKETRVATQMGNQGHSLDDARLAVEYVQAGAIGEVREIHIWTNRPLGFWPQGVSRPLPLPAVAGSCPKPDAKNQTAACSDFVIPEKLDWNLFLGVAPEVSYHPSYHPFNWRGWVDWGVGAIGDMGAHLIDHSMWALDLGLPTSIETFSTGFNGVCYPLSSKTVYEFGPRGSLPPVKLTWYDGGLLPEKPAELGAEDLKREGGALLVGSKGILLHDTYGRNPRLFPHSLHESFGKPPQKLPRIENEDHEMNWVDAAKGKTEASCSFEYAARLTEVMLLGIVALRAQTKIEYDGAAMRVNNAPLANAFLQRESRKGWSSAPPKS